MALLSVGMPVYNGAKYLGQTLEALRKHDFDGEVEVLISDNASTDATGQVAREAMELDPRIRYVRQEKNMGPTWNSNFLFRNTSGEFFTWLACDDVVDPLFHRRLVELLRGRPEAAAAMSRVQMIDPVGTVLGNADEIPTDGDHPDAIARFIRYASFSHWCQYTYAVHRRELLAKTRLFLPFWGSDRLWCAELALAGPLLRHPETLFFVRQHPDRLTRRMGRRDRDRATESFYLTPNGSRAMTLYYAKQLRETIELADLSEEDKARGRSALRGWALRNSGRLMRSAGRATLEAVRRPFTNVNS